MIYQIGETPRLSVVVTNQAGEAADPSSIVININYPDGTAVVTGMALTKLETGSYYYDHTLLSGIYGVYRYNIVAIGAEGRVTIVKDSFQAEVAF